MRIRVRIGFALIFATYITTILSILAGCGASFKKNWQINPDPGSTISGPFTPYILGRNADSTLTDHCQPAISHINLFVTLILNVLTDVYLLSIPIPVGLLIWSNFSRGRPSLTKILPSSCGNPRSLTSRKPCLLLCSAARSSSS